MESYWKEYTIKLPTGKEYVYDVQNINANCVIIRNHNVINIKAGIEPHNYKVVINPNRTGVLNRPFPLNYVYLFTNKSTPVSIIETKTQNPINNFIKQEITKNIIIQDKPKIDVSPIYKIITPARIQIRLGPGDKYYFTFDLGEYGRTNINMHAYAFRYRKGRRVTAAVSILSFASNDNINFIGIPLNLSGWEPGGFFRSFKNFVYRFLRISLHLGTGRRRTVYLKFSFNR